MLNTIGLNEAEVSAKLLSNYIPTDSSVFRALRRFQNELESLSEQTRIPNAVYAAVADGDYSIKLIKQNERVINLNISDSTLRRCLHRLTKRGDLEKRLGVNLISNQYEYHYSCKTG